MVILQKSRATQQNIGKYNNEKKEHKTKDKSVTKKEKSVIILGNSMVKQHVNGWEISKRLPHCKPFPLPSGDQRPET